MKIYYDLQLKICSTNIRVAVRFADGSFTKLSCHSILQKHLSVMHHRGVYALSSKVLILLYL